MQILGISALYHDSAAALIVDGNVIAAAQEERFSRKKHDPGFPRSAIKYCLKEARCSLSDRDAVVFYDKPFLRFERLLQTYVAFAPRGLRSFQMALPVWLREKLFQKKWLADELEAMEPGFKRPDILFTEHHLAHAASAFYPSPSGCRRASVREQRCIAMTEEQKRMFGIDKLNVPRSEIPAVTHVDYSARVQTVSKQTNPLYHALISRFRDLTGCPVVVNTSFNVRGEPIVCTTSDAFRCFMGSEIETLIVGNCFLQKDEQDSGLKVDYKSTFDPD